MPSVRRLLAIAVMAAAAVAAAVAAGPATVPLVPFSAVPASASTNSRVGLVVDTGTEVKRLCVTFSEESISGAELLRRAGVDPVFASYSGQGTAVCSLCQTGCPADDCLTCDPDGRYWSYHRAPWGATSYQYSRAGAGSTEVRDGDVEAWAWGFGKAPQYVAWGDLCDGPAPTRSTTDGSTSDGSGTSDDSGSGSTNDGSSGSGGSGTTTAGPSSPETTVAGAAPTTAAPATAAPAPGSAPPEAATSGGSDAEGTADGAPLVGSGGSDHRPKTDKPDESAGGVLRGQEEGSTSGSLLGISATAVVVGSLLTWAFVLRRRAAATAGEPASTGEPL